MSYFITIEGPEGSGKSTVIEGIKAYFDKHLSVITTREPGGIKISEAIRSIILDSDDKMDYRTEALLFAASRRQHLVEKVLPALKEGKMVICDRFIDSSLAYQGYARGLGVEDILKINGYAIEGKFPDLTLYLHVPPEIGIARIQSNSRETNRLDREKMDFHQRVVDGYEALYQTYPERIVKIDATQSPEAVLNACIQVINKRFNLDMI